MFNAAELRGRRTAGVQGTLAADEALRRLLDGANAEMVRDRSGAYLVRPVGNATEAADAGYRANEIVVTAPKRVESIQDVPHTMTSFLPKNLERPKNQSRADTQR